MQKRKYEVFTEEVVLLLAEDDDGHASLIMKNLRRAGISNQMLRFKDGQETLEFLSPNGEGTHRVPGTAYILLLDIRMPKVDGVEVLRQLKQDTKLHKLPVIMVTTTDNPSEVKRCYELGCSNYITKPIDYDKFINTIRELGLFLMTMEVPKINGG